MRLLLRGGSRRRRHGRLLLLLLLVVLLQDLLRQQVLLRQTHPLLQPLQLRRHVGMHLQSTGLHSLTSHNNLHPARVLLPRLSNRYLLTLSMAKHSWHWQPGPDPGAECCDLLLSVHGGNGGRRHGHLPGHPAADLLPCSGGCRSCHVLPLVGRHLLDV
jgi:hypothetical protein